MKKIFILILMVCLAHVSNLKAANTDISLLDNVVYIEPISAEAGDQMVISLKMKNSAEIRGYEFDLQLPEGVTASTLKNSSGRIPAGDDHNPQLSKVGDNYHFLCSSFNNKAFTGTDGEVATFIIEIANTVAIGDHPIILKDMTLTTTTYGVNYETASIETTLTITGVSDGRVKLNETSEILPIEQDGVNVKVTRTISANNWNTICLPFDMTEAQVEAAFGNGYALAEFDDYEMNGTQITISFTTATPDKNGILLSANSPYIIKTTSPISQFIVDGVDVEVDEEGAISYNTKKLKDATGIFYGTLKAGNIIPADNLFLSNNNFYYSTGTTTIMAFRGYFWIDDFNSSSPAPTFVVNGEATNIEGVQIVNGDGRIYNLNGQHVENPTSKGVYIQNGKKIVMKK